MNPSEITNDINTTEESGFDFRTEMALVRARERAAVAAFIAAAQQERLDVLADTFDELTMTGTWATAFRRAARRTNVSPQLQAAFHDTWVSFWDSIRDSVNDDLALKRGLRPLLPAYIGGDVVLFRGESAFNRSRRTYGLSWTVEEAVADDFARARSPFYQGGTVVLRTAAPAAAIICSPYLLGKEYGEAEYLVDRRRLTSVNVLHRYRPNTNATPAA